MRDQYFYFYNSGLAEPSRALHEPRVARNARVLIDPNTISTDGSTTISGESPSWDAKLLAYATQNSGSDWQTWHVRDIGSGKDLPDTVEWSKFSTAAWLPSNDAFFYERYPTPASGQAYKGALYGQTRLPAQSRHAAIGGYGALLSAGS